MGITLNTAMLLLREREAGIDFSRMGMIGRQQFFSCNLRDYQRMLEINNWNDKGYDLLDPTLMGQGVYTERWFEQIGGGQVESFDANKYENATNIHDFNAPLPSEFWEHYSVILDSGSSEHIFNVAQSFSNYMRMIRTGGHYIGVLPSNQWGGHGFYQFSPEFFYRVFSPENGFNDTRVIIFCEIDNPDYKTFPDPNVAGRRIEFQSKQPASCFVVSRKIANVEPFKSWPQQSDYANIIWQK